MSSSRFAILAVLVATAACGKLLGHEAPDAGSPAPLFSVKPIIVPPEGGVTPAQIASAMAMAGTDASARDAGPECPLPVHPYYCRHRCRSFTVRSLRRHAQRIGPSLRAGVGTCGAYDVFAEDERGPDGGARGGIVEYFDRTTQLLVGAEDSRRPGCGSFGTIPKCKLDIRWSGTK
jgi:hypothetical protein